MEDAARQFYLERHGLNVEDAADLRAVLAAEAIRAGKIDLRVFDPQKAQAVLGVSGDRRLHAKIFVSELGAVAGSANFSRAGLYHNIEYVDEFGQSDDAPESDPSTRAAKERQETAEKIWDASSDWNDEALEILSQLLRPVTAEDAEARTISEQQGFRSWMVGDQKDITGRQPFMHQVDLTYETSSIVYEHGFAFLGSPTGSGKTDIGKLLGQTLSDTFSAAVGPGHTSRVARGGAVVIAPPRVVGNWEKGSLNSLKAIPNTQVVSRKAIKTEDEQNSSRQIENAGVIIIDESHTVTPGFEESSKKAEAIEYAPPSWNVCLSATLLGNKDVDWLTHLKEKRASIFMSPEYINAMRNLFKREGVNTELFREQDRTDALSDEAREDLADMLAPFLAHRQRSCLGESKDRKLRDKATYPPFDLHGRPRNLNLSKKQTATVDEIVRLTGELAPGKRLASIQTSRFGTRTERRHNQNSLYARNLLNVLRANSAQALWQMEHGAIGRNLKKFEQDETRKQVRKAKPDSRQATLFEFPEEDEQNIGTPKCDALIKLLSRSEIQKLDERRIAEVQKIQEKHRRVVFVAERVDTLQIFAKELPRRAENLPDGSSPHINFVVSADQGTSDGGEAKRALTDVCRVSKPSYKAIKKGADVEAYFRDGGKKSPKGPASAFMTYQMAEGINLQSADALVLLGVTSNLKDLIQGLGRIDRIDSPHNQTHYYLIDIPVGKLASDEKAAQRLENYRALSGRQKIEHADEADGDTEAILEGVAQYLREPRLLRDNNFHDVLTDLKHTLDPARYEEINAARIDGMWGAELALLKGKEKFAVLQLEGQEGVSAGAGKSFSPPRILTINADGYVIRNQIACARILRTAYQETLEAGLHQVSPDATRLSNAIELLSHRISQLREWDLRPERTVSLLDSLSVFLSQDPRSGDFSSADSEEEFTLDERMFGDLSLRGLEYLTETWARVLDPYWIKAKQEVRESFASGGAPESYIAVDQIVRHLNNDLLEVSRIRNTMTEAVEAARRINPPRPGAVAERISVAFVSI
ncbi:hypothetical protein [Pseudophaeobacter sp.]|uniref:hypothetical protein n=1 Tax=Pseudophaeobacter sp. TaxID=1971739 RepID=UPI0032979B3A